MGHLGSKHLSDTSPCGEGGRWRAGCGPPTDPRGWFSVSEIISPLRHEQGPEQVLFAWFTPAGFYHGRNQPQGMSTVFAYL